MFQKSKTLFLICETPLHAGSGDALGVVDLPIQRERHTSFPKIEASSLKGALREAFEEKISRDDAQIISTFGSDNSGDQAGAIGFTDARLLLFPVKSMKGVFAWITCPRVLKQFEKDMKMVDNTFEMSAVPANPANNACYTLGEESDLKIGDKNIVLEEFAFTTSAQSIKIGERPLQSWLANYLFEEGDYWYNKAEKSILILSDDDFKDFVNLSTEVITRTKINNETGTVQQGALFTEEYLPSESVLYSVVLASPEFSDKTDKMNETQVMNFFGETLKELKYIVQIGGNATLGKGIVRTIF